MRFLALDLQLPRGGIVAIVGEPGSGKSALARAPFGLHPLGAPRTPQGSLRIGGKDLFAMPLRERQALLGVEVGIAVAEPEATLDPNATVADLLLEGPRQRLGRTKRSAMALAANLLQDFGLDPTSNLMRHSAARLPVGTRQRISVAMALSCSPQLLIVDGGTARLSAREATDFRKSIHRAAEHGLAVLWLTCDLEEATALTPRTLLLTEGRLVPPGEGDVAGPAGASEFARSLQAASFTLRDLSARTDPAGPMATRVVADHLTLAYPLARRWPRPPERRRVLDDVSLTLDAGESLGIVGASGSGKTSLGEILAGYRPATYGSVAHGDPRVIGHGNRHSPQSAVQLVSSTDAMTLDPGLLVGEVIAQAVPSNQPRLNYAELEQAVEAVGLKAPTLQRPSGALSPGEKRLVALARAIARKPALLILDDPLAGLTATIRLRVVTALIRLQTASGTSCVILSPDAERIRPLCHRLAFLLGGRIIETGPTETLLSAPVHPYTRDFLRCAGTAQAEAARGPVVGCSLAKTCSFAIEDQCGAKQPPLSLLPGSSRHRVACFNPPVEAFEAENALRRNDSFALTQKQ